MIRKLETFYRNYFPKRIPVYKKYRQTLQNLKGLEIGGPSAAFDKKGYLPIYDVVVNLDGCNFGAETVWEGKLQEGRNYRYGTNTGYQYISDGTCLSMIEDGKYDFVLSCHSLEHFANPIKALKEWERTIRQDGYLILILPHKDQTFDHKRPVTTLQHLIQDFEQDMQETDTTHFEEVNRLHDISKDPGIDTIASLIKRTEDNYNNRCVHHHVFNTPLMVQLCNHLGYQILDISHFNPFNIILLVQIKSKGTADNQKYLNKNHLAFQKTTFPSDKIW